ncbi:MAG: DUF1178 family protein [Polaromonas sp.]
MKVLNLLCAHQHAFEGWFASEDDFQAQLARGLVECPLCADKGIQKMPSAPRLNLGAQLAPAKAPTPDQRPDADAVVVGGQAGSHPGPHEQAALLKALRYMVANTEDVGDRFADKARAMHYGDLEPRNIRGQASARETVELLEEGIDVMPLPMPAALKETLQ